MIQFWDKNIIMNNVKNIPYLIEVEDSYSSEHWTRSSTRCECSKCWFTRHYLKDFKVDWKLWCPYCKTELIREEKYFELIKTKGTMLWV